MCGLLESVTSEIVSVPVRVPSAPGSGENVTMTLQDPPSAVTVTPLVQVVPELTSLKSLPAIAGKPEIDTFVLVPLVRGFRALRAGRVDARAGKRQRVGAGEHAGIRAWSNQSDVDRAARAVMWTVAVLGLLTPVGEKLM